MEEKKLDVKSIVGFLLIGALLIWMLYNQTPSQEEINKEKAKQEQIDKAKQKQIPEQNTASVAKDSTKSDSLLTAKLRSSLGAFAYSATLPSATANVTEIKNELLTLRISNKGGYIEEANVNFEQFRKGSNRRVELIKNNNASLNLQFKTADNRILNTKDMYFEPIVTKNGQNTVLTMRLKAGADQFP
jgi:YidC/Oxa1 family membrane protein insertase